MASLKPRVSENERQTKVTDSHGQTLTSINTPKTLSKSHFPKNIKRNHFKPLGHIDALVRFTTFLTQSAHKPIYTASDNSFLFNQRFGGEGSRESLFHLTVLYRISLGADTRGAKARAKDIVEFRFYQGGLALGRVAVDCFPGVYAGEGEFVGGYAEDWACVETV